LCIKFVNYSDKYTEMHGQQIIKIASVIAEPLFVMTQKCKQKVNYTPVQALRLCTSRTAHRGVEVLEVGEGSALHPGRFLPPGKTRYQLYRWLGGPQGRTRQVRKVSPPPGFDPRTVQPVASRYTD